MPSPDRARSWDEESAGLVRLTLACGDYDRTRALRDGTVKPRGVDLTCVTLPPIEIFRRMLRHQEFEASELGFVPFMLALERGEPELAGIPVFPSRSFRHSAIYVNDRAKIDHPRDLVGKRVGVLSYVNTAAVWVRGILSEDHGVRPEQIHWLQSATVNQAFQPPEGISLEAIPENRTLDDMLTAGELDALISPTMPAQFVAGSPRVRRLFTDFAGAEKDYFRRTGVFPIMHLVVIRRAVYRSYPWLGASLYEAFTAAKAVAMQSLYETVALKNSLPWMIAEIEEVRALFGRADYWPYGLDDDMNRRTLDALTRYAHEQGITSRRFAVEELFAT